MLNQSIAYELIKPYLATGEVVEHIGKNNITNINLPNKRKNVIYLEPSVIEFSFSNVDEEVEEWIADKEYKVHNTKPNGKDYLYYRIRYEELSTKEFIELFEHLYYNVIDRTLWLSK